MKLFDYSIEIKVMILKILYLIEVDKKTQHTEFIITLFFQSSVWLRIGVKSVVLRDKLQLLSENQKFAFTLKISEKNTPIIYKLK